ncbi:quercetin 2,3-dioxygenase [Aureococcus anophagefferens]|nr:quercetin 2,3-dioxygenase [Aureococcus anophagefferens]
MRLVLALLAGVGALQGAPKALKNPLNEFRKKLAQWSLEDAAMRREVQKEMRREELVGSPTPWTRSGGSRSADARRRRRDDAAATRASVPGPRRSSAAEAYLDVVRNYERRRVEIIREKIPRPKDADPTSVAGVVEALNARCPPASAPFASPASSSAALLPVLPNEYDADYDDDAAFARATKRGPGGPR